ncbi:MAG: hypothetical protein AAGB46_04560 [Verrucomicrobiota bacterium]
MIAFIKNLLRRKPVKTDALLYKADDDYRMQNAQFVSFLQQSGFRKRQLNRHEKTKRLKKIVAVAAIWIFLLGFTWVAIESAQALDIF